MAVIHDAVLTPSKLELLAGWVPTRPWGSGVTDLEQVGAYRFDDPGTALATAILSAGEQAPVLRLQGGLEVPRAPDVLVRGSGSEQTDVPRFGSARPRPSRTRARRRSPAAPSGWPCCGSRTRSRRRTGRC